MTALQEAKQRRLTWTLSDVELDEQSEPAADPQEDADQSEAEEAS